MNTIPYADDSMKKNHCDICDRDFPTSHGLKIHSRRMHRVPKKLISPIPPDPGLVPLSDFVSEQMQRRDLPMDTENFFLWFLMRRGTRMKGLKTTASLCGAVCAEIEKLERELDDALNR